jgi:hypothetical protein
MDALGQLVLGKRGESAAEGRFAGNVSGAFPAAKSAERGPGAEGFDERAGGGELIDVLGDEGVGQPDARTGRTALAAPFITAGKAAELGERDDFTELLIQGRKLTQFLGEGGKKLALQAVEDRRQVEQAFPTASGRRAFKRPGKNPNEPKF